MKINAISSANYISNNKVNSNSLSFGMISNMAELTTRIEQDVKSCKVTKEFANQTIEAIKNIKFSMPECFKRFKEIDGGLSLSGRYGEFFDRITNEIYLPSFNKSCVDYNDLPFTLKNYSIEPYKYPESYLGPKYKEGKKYHQISLVKDFNDIGYNGYKRTYEVLENDVNKLIGNISKTLTSSCQCFTEFLKVLVEEERIQKAFVEKYAMRRVRDVKWLTFT